MTSTVEILSNVSNIKQEVDETPRGVKRSYFDMCLESTTESEQSSFSGSPGTVRLSESSGFSGSDDQSSEYLSSPKEEPEEYLVEPETYYDPDWSSEQEVSPPAKKRRGRPPGKKNKSKEENIKEKEVEWVTVTNENRIVKAKCRRRTYEDKTAFTYPMVITMAIINSPEERATCAMMYDFAVHHFPSISGNSSWKNTLRHALAPQAGFEKEQMSKCSFWYIRPDRRADLIKAMVETAKEYENQPEALKMRDINELPKLLVGQSRMPEEAKVHSGQMTEETVKSKPASQDEFDNILKINRIKFILRHSDPVPKPCEEQEVEILQPTPMTAEKPFVSVAKSCKKPEIEILETTLMSIEPVDKPAVPVVKTREQQSEVAVLQERQIFYKVPRPPVEQVTPRQLPRHKPMPRVVQGSPFRYVTPGKPAPPRGYWAPYADASTSYGYSNPWQPAHHPVYDYGGQQPGYGMPMYAQKENGRHSDLPPKREYILIEDEKTVVGSFSSSRNHPGSRHHR